MTYRVRNIMIAVALAVVAGLLTLFYVTSYKKHVDSQQKSVDVLVAKSDIPAGMLGSQALAGHMFTTQQIARKAVVPGLITNPKQVSKLIVVQPIYQGEQVTARRFGPIAEQGIRTQLKGAFRAMELNGDANQTLAGTIHPGDHVDVVGVVTLDHGASDNALTFARVAIRDVLVLRASGSSAASKVTSPGNNANSVTLRVTDNQSQKLALVYKKGDYWALELRPALNDADSPNSVETGWTLLTDGIGPAKIAQALGGGR
jgi:pilus assembly protein CpaB